MIHHTNKLFPKIRCLESNDDQEYVKQLALSSLNTLLTLSQSKGVKCEVDIELIVSSLKTTTNPRTQRETLILLCHTAHLVPVRLLFLFQINFCLTKCFCRAN
jgi:hypothetical protein